MGCFYSREMPEGKGGLHCGGGGAVIGEDGKEGQEG